MIGLAKGRKKQDKRAFKRKRLENDPKKTN
ncbi:MAG: hypothetical protein Ct9H300mP4_15540 [Gammaproteobacteria bacterium]|nr:MAG: hypothetical protein Ct9H300mP4_15540 [Gammaproteobacteria bacterium]